MGPSDLMYSLFLEREQQYADNTLNIWANIPFVTDAIKQYLGAPAQSISWLSIDKIGPEIVIMLSIRNDDRFMYVKPGSIASRVLTIIIPTSVAETDDANLICEYLKETQDIRNQDMHPELERGGVVHVTEATRRVLH